MTVASSISAIACIGAPHLAHTKGSTSWTLWMSRAHADRARAATTWPSSGACTATADAAARFSGSGFGDDAVTRVENLQPRDRKPGACLAGVWFVGMSLRVAGGAESPSKDYVGCIARLTGAELASLVGFAKGIVTEWTRHPGFLWLAR
jgi:hypothetical protein